MTATAPRDLRCPPPTDGARTRLRAAAGAAQLAWGVRRLHRTGTGWYHVVLGVRQLAQARLDAAGAFSPSADTAVDSIHVATMLGVAVVRRRRRRQALLGAASAFAWAVLDALLTRRRPTPPGVPLPWARRRR